jgi:type I restriction enzyme, S subunit
MVKLLRDLCEVITKGTTPTTLGKQFVESGISFLRVQNLQDGTIILNDDTLYIDDETDQLLLRSRIYPDDVLLSIAGTIGRSALVPDNVPALNCNQAVAIIRPNRELFASYLRYWLESTDAQSQMLSSKVTGTISNLSLTNIGNLKIPLPTLDEQKRIAATLDKADALREKRRQAIAKLNTLLQSVFRDMFGDPVTNPKEWKKSRFSEVFKTIRYGTGSPPEYISEGIPFIRATNIKNGKIVSNDLKFISSTDAAKIEKCKLNYGDLIIVRSGVNSGDCAMVPKQYKGAYAAYDLILQLDYEYAVFYNYLINSSFGKQSIGKLTRRAAQPHLNAEQVSNCEFIIPPKAELQKFVRFNEAIEKLRAKKVRNLEKLNDLFQSLQQRAFKGELFNNEIDESETLAEASANV